jgi:hypothetical protein
MAAYTSTQSGDFNAVATWGGGGYPDTDGDTFNIVSPHVVTYTNTTTVATGFGASYVRAGATLQWATGTTRGQYPIRMNGNLDVYGNIIAGIGAHVIMNSAVATVNNNFILRSDAAGNSRKEFIGSYPLPETTTTVLSTQQQGFFTVSSTSGMANGDWIAVYKRGLASHLDRTDEGFYIHDISGSNIYVREFVGPHETISSVTGSTITVSDASKYRLYQKLIFGTGANRNVVDVVSINIILNIITVSTAIVGSVIGETVYTTGPFKIHPVGDIVRKMSTTVSDAAINSTSFDLADATGYNIGDSVVIENRSSVLDDEKPIMVQISGKTGNTITVDEAVTHAVTRGAHILNYTRGLVFETENYGRMQWVENNVDEGNILMHRDVEYKHICFTNTNSTWARLDFRGRWGSDTDADGFEIEGCSFYCDDIPPQVSSAQLWIYRYAYRSTWRCNAFHNLTWGMFVDLGYDSDDLAIYNSHSSKMEAGGYYVNHADGITSEIAYNVANGIDDVCFSFAWHRDQGLGIHHNQARNGDLRGFDIQAPYVAAYLYQNLIDTCFEPMSHLAADNTVWVYNEINNDNNVGVDDWYSLTEADIRTGASYNTRSLMEHNYKSNGHAILFSGGQTEWNDAETAWLFRFDNDNTSYFGLNSQVWVPAGTTMRVEAKVKLVAGFSGTAPRLYALAGPDRWYAGTTLQLETGDHPAKGYSVSANASNIDFTWQTLQVTLPQQSFGRWAAVGVVNININATEGWYMRPKKIMFDIMPHISATRMSNLDPLAVLIQGSSFTAKVNRIGGA